MARLLNSSVDVVASAMALPKNLCGTIFSSHGVRHGQFCFLCCACIMPCKRFCCYGTSLVACQAAWRLSILLPTYYNVRSSRKQKDVQAMARNLTAMLPYGVSCSRPLLSDYWFWKNWVEVLRTMPCASTPMATTFSSPSSRIVAWRDVLLTARYDRSASN